MSLLVADCPRCRSASMTFDVIAHQFVGRDYPWRVIHEVFSVCRHCQHSTIFLIRRRHDVSGEVAESLSNDPAYIMSLKEALNPYFELVRYIGLRDLVPIRAPEHLPHELRSAFEEGAACLSIGCNNAAACMFRLCLDLVSRPLLSDPSDAALPQATDFERRNLGPRLKWLFGQGKLPADLRDLADCVRGDGNDGAHAGNLTKEDAEDLLDFTVAFLERLITEPEKIKLADARRAVRRKKP